ncbi:hypothetical protein [Photorhabdus namnaonensis]|uniref:Uncharacterized protein n=1 Tax=Photorhabdus namnaonensis TaxID=1851568 RepID=A0A1B8YJ84_9GAMM|nr:hypothetical protein [Photorhabdus namnaonensis]OCA55179.1 hypothetical protein Phpb_01797 [Photorhabdus namnaonensis]
MTDNNHDVSSLVQIIESVWSNPTEITTAIWRAGYRKPERSEEEIILLIIDVMNGVPDWVPHNERPKDLNDIFRTELDNIIFDVTWEGKATPTTVARVILDNGYRRSE